MPPKATTQPKVPDVKARKITDFWGKSDAGSSPQVSRQASAQWSPASSPMRKLVTNTSTPASKPRLSNSLYPGGLATNNGQAVSNNVASSLNTSQPNSTPRKFIVISSDEDETDPEPKTSASKKRPRESAPPAPEGPAAIRSPRVQKSIPETFSRTTMEHTDSPPRKIRVTEVVASGSHSRTTSSALSGYSSHPEFSPVTPSSPEDSHFVSLDAIIASNGGSMSDASLTLGATAPFSAVGTSTESTLLSSEISGPKEQNPQDKARSKVEEMRRLAEAKQRADQVQPTRVYHPMVLGDSDEEDDPLEKLNPIRRVQPTAEPKSKPASTTRKCVCTPLPADPFDGMPPLTEPDSDGQSIDGPSARSNGPNVTTRSRSRAASQAPELPPPIRNKTRSSSKAPILPPPSRSRASSKPPTLPPPASRAKETLVEVAPAASSRALPSSLASLLEDSPSSNRRRDDPKTLELMKAVKRDMMGIDQRILYGGAIEYEGLENSRHIDPSVTEMALGEKDGRKMNEVLASDNATATHISPWRSFWDEQLVGARDVSMDVEYQIPPLSLSNISHPILAHLRKVLVNKDSTHLALFLSSGILSGMPPNMEDESLVPWLFLLACDAPDHVANAAQQSLHANLSRHVHSRPDRYQLVFSHLMDPILSLGPLAEAVAPLRRSEVAITPPRDPITRNVVVSRLICIIKMASKEMLPQNPEGVILLLLLLYLDPATPSDVRREISLVVEDIILSLTSHPDDREREKVLVVCKKIIAISADFRTVEKKTILDCIFGGQPGPRNFMRWIAVGLLLPDVVQSLEWTEYLQPPSLGLFAAMLPPSLMTMSPFRIWPKTNYHDLSHLVDILGTILTDIGLYGAKEDQNIDRIINGLLHIHGKIVDARAAFIERTQAKDALQRLRLRVHFQFQRTMKAPKPIATIDAMLKR